MALLANATSNLSGTVRAAPRSAAAAAVRPISVAHRTSRQQAVVCPQQQQRVCAAQQQCSWLVRSSSVSSSSSGSSGAPEGQVSSAIMEAMQAKIQDELQADTVVVSDVHGDGRHVSIDVISSIFEGKNSVQRQRMVYKAIWLELQETVHAVDAMTTKTPQEAAA